ncbi:MAG TPA: S9 family peptidase [Vicinamibacterales bacterium]|nr:S9 family peptidase [Vicinamibacterales bacterium]
MRKTLLVATLICAASIASAQTKSRVATFDDVLNIKAVQGATVSPDGRTVIYTVRQWVVDQDPPTPLAEAPASSKTGRIEARTHIWRVPADGSSVARQITFGERGDSQPQFSPDGKYISFVSARGSAEAKPQIYLMSVDGGEAWRLTDAKEGVSSQGGGGYSWSPDSSQIAFVTLDPRSAEEEANIKKRDDERVFEGDFRYQHAWVITIANKHATRVTEGTHYTVQGAPSWAPDGKRFVFAASATPMLRDERRDVYVATLGSANAAGGPATRIEKISTNFGNDAAPRWSPDGQTIAWLTQPNTAAPLPDQTAPSVITQQRLVLYDVNAKTIKDVSATTFDVDPGNPTFTNEGKRVMFVAGKRAYNEVFAYDLTSGTYTQLTQRKTISNTSVSRDGKTIVLTMDAPDAPAEVYVTDPSFANLKRLTATNPQLAEIAQGETEVVTWKSADGAEIEGVLLKPVGYQSGKRYPTLVVAHGGPAGAFVNGFRFGGLEGGQVWAGNGWAVFYPNPRGSSNYGENTLRANVNDWGGGDFKDINTGVDALVARGIADPEKLAHIGWSYGGYMTAWTITQTTRYKAAMVGAGLTNMWSMYGTNDIPSVLIAYFGGIPNKQTLPLYLDRSAMTHIDKASTPTLILHGANDERVPTGQAYELYRGLKDRGTPTQLVFYPREGHGITEYYHQKDRMQRIYDWVTKYTLGAAATTTAQ